MFKAEELFRLCGYPACTMAYFLCFQHGKSGIQIAFRVTKSLQIRF